MIGLNTKYEESTLLVWIRIEVKYFVFFGHLTAFKMVKQ